MDAGNSSGMWRFLGDIIYAHHLVSDPPKNTRPSITLISVIQIIVIMKIIKITGQNLRNLRIQSSSNAKSTAI